MNRTWENRDARDAALGDLPAQPGTVLIESPGLPTGWNLMASNPDLIVSGRDWPALELEVARRREKGPPGGAAVGYVDFDGEFHFAFYDRTDRVPPPSHPAPPAHGLSFSALLSEPAYIAMVARAREYIAAGDIYQVCLSHPFESPANPAQAWEFYEALRTVSPAPYAAFLNLGDTRIASASPECFLRLNGREICTRPIKGTRPRNPDPSLDADCAADLQASPKEAAELLMITDLERNDLGRVCEYGSIKVRELMRLERYSQVFHLVSTVTGRLRGGISHVAALHACFPGGSISGAPKKRALEIIRELEPFPRGIYTGAIGYFGYNGHSEFSIAIRTAIFSPHRAIFHAGAGIVADSLPAQEWQETLDKASGLLLAAGSTFSRPHRPA